MNSLISDFDDSCYFWLIYELARAWEAGIDRVMSHSPAERQDLMNRYKDQVMAGYNLENTITDEWMARLPLFIRIIRMQELMHYTQYLNVPDERAQAGLRYKIRWIEEDIPSMVFFDRIFDP